MDCDTYTELGRIQRKKGLRGSMVIGLYQVVPQIIAPKTLFIQMGHTLVPYAIESLFLQHLKAIIKLQGIDDSKAVHALIGRCAFVTRDTLPQVFFQKSRLAQLIGYQAMDINKGKLGTVKSVDYLPQQHVLIIDYQGKELLIPYHEDIVLNIVHAQRLSLIHI